MPFFTEKKIYILAQILVLLGLLLVQMLPLVWGLSFPLLFWLKQVVVYFVWVGVFYLTLKILIPLLLYKGRAALFFIAIILLIAATLYISHSVENLLGLKEALLKHFKISEDVIHKESYVIADFSVVIITLMVIGSSTIISIAQKLQWDAMLRQNLERDKVSTELSFLKAQINPHFFFNILNSIYALSANNDTTARDAIYTLSHLMRYVLYDTKNNMTTLSKEVAFVEDYMKLMELRLTDKVQVIFNKPATFKDVPVAPMLFLPFIENAYKHGISSIHPSYIYIGIEQRDNWLVIEVRNSLFLDQAPNIEESNGIGLANTRRRLDLIYPGKYVLNTDANAVEKEYQVTLKLDTV